MIDGESGASVRLQTLPADDFPVIAAEFPDLPLRMDATTLRHDLERLSPCMSTEEARYYLNGVAVHIGGAPDAPDLRFAATDGHKLARIVRPLPDGLAEQLEARGKAHPLREGAVSHGSGIIIPRKAVKVLAAIIGKKGAGVIEMAVSGKAIRFAFGGVAVTSKLIDGSFPDYSRVIPAGISYRLDIQAGALADMTAGATAHCTDKLRAVKLSVGPGWATASATNADGEFGAACHPGATVGRGEGLSGPVQPFAIGFNSAYVLALTAQLGADAVATIKMDNADCPVRITAADAPELLYVLMPMRIGGEPFTPAEVRMLNGAPIAVAVEPEPIAPAPAAVEAVEPPAEPVEPEPAPCALAVPCGDQAEGADPVEAEESYSAVEPVCAAIPVEPQPGEPVSGDMQALQALVADLASRLAVLEASNPAAAAVQPAAPVKRERSAAHVRAIRAYLAVRASRAEARAHRAAWAARAKAAEERAQEISDARDAVVADCERLETALAGASRDARRVYSVEEALAGARRRGDRLARAAAKARKRERQAREDVRGSRAESAALLRRLQEARTAPARPYVMNGAPRVGTMAVAFAAAN